MLTRIHLEGYRAFEDYRLDGLSRVNLLVGKNNCGKTSLLEAIHLLATDGHPRVLAGTTAHRGEMLAVQSEERDGHVMLPDISHLFYGHEFAPGARFRISSEDRPGELTVSVLSLTEADEQPELFKEAEKIHAPFAVRCASSRPAAPASEITLPVTEDGALSNEWVYRSRRIPLPETKEPVNVLFIGSDSLGSRSMTNMWDEVIRDARESGVIDAIRILEPKLKSLFFLSGATALRPGGLAGIVAEIEGEKRRVPFGTLGDGMRRLLALSLCLIKAKAGVLLVDEIDTGLHYSIMGNMWLLATKAAIQSDVQVFATTHSLDCVRGLAWLCENYPDLRSEVSVQKIDRSLDRSVALDAKDIIIADQQGIEVR